jgi:hypothetical protein
MTEAEWLAATDPWALFDYLGDRIPERKAALYVCGGLRVIWDRWLYHDSSRRAVEVAERWADGQATADELGHAVYRAEVPTFGFDFESVFSRQRRRSMHGEFRVRHIKGIDPNEYDMDADDTPKQAPLGDPEKALQLVNAAHIAYHGLHIHHRGLDDHLFDHLSQQADWPGGWLVRDIFDNPFRPVAFDPAWRSEAAVSLATGIYADRAFDRMPILADALEEAGCDHPDVLAHCRGPGPHVRGCWVVDLVLGKQ